MIAVETNLPADVRRLARAIAARPGSFLLASASAQALHDGDHEASFVGCDPIATSNEIVPSRKFPTRVGWAGRRAAPRWVGFVPYESARVIERRPALASDRRAPATVAEPRWFAYDAVARVDRSSGKVVIEADDGAAAERLRDKLASAIQAPTWFSVGSLVWSEDDETHANNVRRILEYIRAGDVYQVNLARRASFDFDGDALALFEALTASAPSPYGFFLRANEVTVVGTSPELALEGRGRRLRTTPIKGTRPRGVDASSDAAAFVELDGDAKERAELAMATDLHRNDLGKVAEPGSVRVLGAPRVVLGLTVMSRVAEVVAVLEGGRSTADAVRAFLPCGSVTGAPKIRAMEIIAELESARRGLYTGLVGTVRRDGDLTLAMAIRTAVLNGSKGEYFAGGGIVLESDPAREAAETRWKAEHLQRLTMRASR